MPIYISNNRPNLWKPPKSDVLKYNTNKVYSIYRATNKITGKIYIGYTSNFDKRQRGHYMDAIRGQTIFNQAFRQFGYYNFTWDIIYQSKDGEYCWNIMEPYFIKEYRSFIGYSDCNGYNMTTGGPGTIQAPKNYINKARLQLQEEIVRYKKLIDNW